MVVELPERWQNGLNTILVADTHQAALDAAVMIVAEMLAVPAVGVLRDRSEYLSSAADQTDAHELAPLFGEARRMVDPHLAAISQVSAPPIEHRTTFRLIFREADRVLGAICAQGCDAVPTAAWSYFELLQLVFVQTEQRLRQLSETQLLYEISLRLSSTLDMTELLQQVLSLTATTFAAASCRIFLFDERVGDLVVSADSTRHSEAANSLRIPIDGTIAGQVVRDGEPLIRNDPVVDPSMVIERENGNAAGKIICVPLKHSSRTLGAIMLINQIGDPDFLDDDLRLLTTVGATVAVMIANARLYQRAIRDALTGAYNRGAFDMILGEYWTEWQASGCGFALILLDLDDFKQINDRLGHLAGDQVLQQVTRILWETLREDDTIFRYGGEEFGILLRNLVNPQTVSSIAERLRAALERELAVNSLVRVRISASFGVVIHPIHGANSSRELLDMADDAAYQAKRNGKNQVAVAPLPSLA